MKLKKVTVEYDTETKFYLATIDGIADKPVWKAKSLSKLMHSLTKYFKSQGE